MIATLIWELKSFHAKTKIKQHCTYILRSPPGSNNQFQNYKTTKWSDEPITLKLALFCQIFVYFGPVIWFWLLDSVNKVLFEQAHHMFSQILFLIFIWLFRIWYIKVFINEKIIINIAKSQSNSLFKKWDVRNLSIMYNADESGIRYC